MEKDERHDKLYSVRMTIEYCETTRSNQGGVRPPFFSLLARSETNRDINDVVEFIVY